LTEAPDSDTPRSTPPASTPIDTTAVPTPNRTLFREVNERIRDVNETFSLSSGSYELVCECDACSCMTRVDVPRDVYETVRMSADRFLVIAGHEHGGVLVDGTEVYSVVAHPVEAPIPG
jgi:hypothetical protein